MRCRHTPTERAILNEVENFIFFFMLNLRLTDLHLPWTQPTKYRSIKPHAVIFCDQFHALLGNLFVPFLTWNNQSIWNGLEIHIENNNNIQIPDVTVTKLTVAWLPFNSNS